MRKFNKHWFTTHSWTRSLSLFCGTSLGKAELATTTCKVEEDADVFSTWAFSGWMLLQLGGHWSCLWHSCSKGSRGYLNTSALMWAAFRASFAVKAAWCLPWSQFHTLWSKFMMQVQQTAFKLLLRQFNLKQNCVTRLYASRLKPSYF